MALIKNLTKKDPSVRISLSVPEPLLRRFDAYRLFLSKEEESGGYLPERSETAEQFLRYVLGEDKGFAKWYRPDDRAQLAEIDALQKKDAPAAKAGDSLNLGQPE